MAKKEFDAVEMTRRIRDAIYEQLKDATPEEQTRFYREQARRLHAELEHDRGQSPKPSSDLE